MSRPARTPTTSVRPERLVVVAGHTETARIDGLSAAGADPDAMVHTPAADLEICAYGRPVRAPVVPASPTGCPTPAVVTRAVRELVGLEVLPVDAGLARPTAAPTVDLDAAPGGDVRDPMPVPGAGSIYEAARRLGEALPDDHLLLGETIPGGTTTALGVLTALGERPTVSSSLPDNPLGCKRDVVESGLRSAGLSPGEAAGEPLAALRAMGDPVLAAVAGLLAGTTETDTRVTLAGGTQLAAAAALARHAGVEAPLALATTSFLADDDSSNLRGLAADLDLALTVTDPGFERNAHPALDAYVAGEAKEGVGMGGALARADAGDVTMADLRERVITLTERLLDDQGATWVTTAGSSIHD